MSLMMRRTRRAGWLAEWPLITGGAQGIGRAIAALFQREGACVFILDCDSRAATNTAAELTAHNSSVAGQVRASRLGKAG